MATHFSILAWKISLAEELGGPQSIGLPSLTQLKRLSMQHGSHAAHRHRALSRVPCAE